MKKSQKRTVAYCRTNRPNDFRTVKTLKAIAIQNGFTSPIICRSRKKVSDKLGLNLLLILVQNIKLKVRIMCSLKKVLRNKDEANAIYALFKHTR